MANQTQIPTVFELSNLDARHHLSGRPASLGLPGLDAMAVVLRAHLADLYLRPRQGEWKSWGESNLATDPNPIVRYAAVEISPDTATTQFRNRVIKEVRQKVVRQSAGPDWHHFSELMADEIFDIVWMAENMYLMKTDALKASGEIKPLPPAARATGSLVVWKQDQPSLQQAVLDSLKVERDGILFATFSFNKPTFLRVKAEARDGFKVHPTMNLEVHGTKYRVLAAVRCRHGDEQDVALFVPNSLYTWDSTKWNESWYSGQPRDHFLFFARDDSRRPATEIPDLALPIRLALPAPPAASRFPSPDGFIRWEGRLEDHEESQAMADVDELVEAALPPANRQRSASGSSHNPRPRKAPRQHDQPREQEQQQQQQQQQQQPQDRGQIPPRNQRKRQRSRRAKHGQAPIPGPTRAARGNPGSRTEGGMGPNVPPPPPPPPSNIPPPPPPPPPPRGNNYETNRPPRDGRRDSCGAGTPRGFDDLRRDGRPVTVDFRRDGRQNRHDGRPVTMDFRHDGGRHNDHPNDRYRDPRDQFSRPDPRRDGFFTDNTKENRHSGRR